MFIVYSEVCKWWKVVGASEVLDCEAGHERAVCPQSKHLLRRHVVRVCRTNVGVYWVC